MSRAWMAASVLTLWILTPQTSAQTYEELKKENAALKARIQALEAEMGVEGVVVSYDPATFRLVVKVGDKERTLELKPKTHVHDPEGYEVSVAERPARLTPGVNVGIIEEDGQLIEINIGGGKHKHAHAHDHKHDGDHGGHNGHHHDYFRRAHSHRNGHGESCVVPGTCPAPHGQGQGQAHGNGHAGHDQCIEFKSFCDRRTWHAEEEHAHGHTGHGNGHGSVEGYPFFHSNRLEPAFIERALETTFAWAKSADNGIFDEYELEVEFIWAVNDRIELVAALPYIWLSPTGTAEEVDGALEFPGRDDGFGDMEAGVNFLAFNGERFKLKFGLAVTIPIGKDSLSAGITILEPVAFGLLDFGGGVVLHGEAAFEIPVHAEEVENEFRYGLALHKTLLGTEHSRFFRWLTPMIEANGLTVLNGPEAGLTVLDLTPGLRWIVREHDDVGFGVSFPITNARNFDHQFIFRYLIHF